MRQTSLIACGLMGCWAPEMEQQTNQPSQPQTTSESRQEVNAPIQNRPNASHTQEEKKEIQEQGRKPPYTAWTMQKDM